MNLHALRIFMHVASMKNVTRASEQLSLSQPAVTIQLRNLEREIGLKLVESEGRGIKLTKEGEFLFMQAESLFEMEKEIENKLLLLKRGEATELRISSTYFPANFLLPVWLAEFKKSSPEMNVHLYSGNSKQVIDRLLHYKADIAFIVNETRGHPDVHYQHLINLDYWFIVPNGHKYDGKEVSLVELMSEPFLLREAGSSTRDILFSLCKVHNIPLPKVGLQFHGLHESIHSVVAGYGVMLAPALAVKGYLKRKEVGKVFVKDSKICRPLYMLWRKKDKQPTINPHPFVTFVQTFIN